MLSQANAKYALLCRENATLIDQLQHRTAQLEHLSREFESVTQEIKGTKETVKKLTYENEKLFAECQTSKKL
jgi:predicted nuclease with TOPRIM domain